MINLISPNSTKGFQLLAKHWNEPNNFFERFGWRAFQTRKNRARLKGEHQDILLDINPAAYEKLMQRNQLK